MILRYLLFLIALTVPQHMCATQMKIRQDSEAVQRESTKRLEQVIWNLMDRFRAEREEAFEVLTTYFNAFIPLELQDELPEGNAFDFYQNRIVYPPKGPLTLQQRALLSAAKNSDAKAVRALLEQQVNPNIADTQGITPLMWAVLRDNSEIFSLLLAAFADPDAQDAQGFTALMQAASLPSTASRRLMIVPLILIATLNLDRVLVLAKSHGNQQTVKFLMDIYNALLFEAIESYDPEGVNQALAIGADVNAKVLVDLDDIGAMTPLMKVAESPERTYPDDDFSSLEANIIRAILKAGARINEQDERGHTALMFAAVSGNFNVAQLLLNAGADTGLRDKNGERALDLARELSYCFHSRMVAVLLEEYQKAESILKTTKADIEDEIKTDASWAAGVIRGYLLPSKEEIREILTQRAAAKEAERTGQPEEEIIAELRARICEDRDKKFIIS